MTTEGLKHTATKKEPLIHITKNSAMPFWKGFLIRVAAVVIAFGLCSLLSYLMIGAKPVEFLQTIWQGSFGKNAAATKILGWKLAKDTAVLLCIALAITPAFRMKFWNIGAEGQVLIGALASVAVVYYSKGNIDNNWLLILMLLASLLAGMIWAVIPAIFKALWNSNETLFTLMMNYAATYFVAFCLVKWTPDGSSTLGELKTGFLPSFGHRYLVLILTVLLITALLFVYLYFSKQGYEISVVGESQRTAQYIGINVKKVIIRTMAISGALCGLTGFLIVSAIDHSVTVNTVGGRGFTAIIVSWLAKFNPLIMIGVAFLIVFLNQGTSRVATNFNVGKAFPDLVVGIIIFFIIGCEFFIRYKVHIRGLSNIGKGKKKAGGNSEENQSGEPGAGRLEAGPEDATGQTAVQTVAVPDKEGRIK